MKMVYQDAKGKETKKVDCNYNVSWNKEGTRAYIVSDNIPIPPFTSYVDINLNSEIEYAYGGKSDFTSKKTVEIPGMNDFVSIRNVSTNLVKNNEQNYDQILVIETKGSIPVEEIAKICTIDERIIPTIDFGHVNSFTGGGLKTVEDFEKVILTFKEHLGERFKKMHIHFSKIEYGKKGEIRHLTFDDSVYGPNFEELAKVLKKYEIQASVICESAGKQTRDAVMMKKIYQA